MAYRICLHCNTSFTRPKAQLSRQRFCSKSCFYAWHRATNHQQYTKVSIACEVCGTESLRTPSQVTNVTNHYCSRKCAAIGSRGKRAGSESPTWKGGSIDSRGPHWDITRTHIIELNDSVCSECGMTNEEHIVTYKKVLHVHHIIPYRLSMDNSPANLTPLCIPCHMRVEQEFAATVTPMEKLLMAENTKRCRALGMNKKQSRKAPCPMCGGPMTPQSKTCQKCWAKNHPFRKPKNYCPNCGVQIVLKSTTCHKCYLQRIASPEPPCCPDCGAKMRTPYAKRCRPCQARLNGKHSKGPKPLPR